MSLTVARHAALSGLDLQTRRMDVSASNVANLSTDEYQAARVEPVTQEQSGVDSRIALTGEPNPVTVDTEGQLRTLSNTNLAQERVSQIQASNAFSANLEVLKTTDEMERSLLDLKA